MPGIIARLARGKRENERDKRTRELGERDETGERATSERPRVPS